MSRSAVILLLGAAWVISVSRAQLGVSTGDMQNAVKKLEDRFFSIRDEGLGIDSLEVHIKFSAGKAMNILAAGCYVS